jgi:hypothetical protein
MEALDLRIEVLKTALKNELETEDSKKIAIFTPHAQDSGIDPSPVIYSDELHYLNTQWSDWNNPTQFTTHRPLTGKIIVFLKRTCQNFIFNSIFKGYFDREKAFNSNLIRFCNSTARYIDARDKKIFWDLIKKVDNEINHFEMRNDTLFVTLMDEMKKSQLLTNQTIKAQENLISSLEKRIAALEGKSGNLNT